MSLINFSIFRQNFPEYDHITDEWLQWFIGFSEGDGSFIITSRGRCEFVISQYEPNIQVLEEIHKTFNFGSINVQSPRLDRSVHKGKSAKEAVYRWIVRDLKSQQVLIFLFNNGNLILPIKKAKFKKWCETYIICFNRAIKNRPKQFGSLKEFIINIPDEQTLFNKEDAWLAGFTDADGCFSLTFNKKDNGYQIRYIIGTEVLQKDKDTISFIFDHIKSEIFDNNGFFNKKNNFYEYTLTGTKNHDKLVYSYFDKFISKCPSKLRMYLCQKILCEKIIRKDHMEEKKRKEMILLWKSCSTFKH